MKRKIISFLIVMFIAMSLFATGSEGVDSVEVRSDLNPPWSPSHVVQNYEVVLTWGEPRTIFGRASEDPPLGYNVYRTLLNAAGNPAGDTVLLNQDGLVDVLWFRDKQLLTNVSYRYDITAVYPNEEESDPDWASVFVTIKTVTAPWEEDIEENVIEADWGKVVPGWRMMKGELTATSDELVGAIWTWDITEKTTWVGWDDSYQRLPLSFNYYQWVNEVDGEWTLENYEWLASPSIVLESGIIYELELDIALTPIDWFDAGDLIISDDARLVIVISTDNGVTWSTDNIIKQWVGNELLELLVDVPEDYKIPVTPITLSLPLDTDSELIKIGFYVEMLTGQTTYNLWITNIRVLEGETSDYDITVPTPQVAMLSNFPNPFNPETTISFSIPKDGIVEIDVYNVRGQKVTTLTNEFYTAGTHNITWNGRNEEGQSMGSGIYFYRLTTDGHTVTRRMMLLK